MTNYKHLICEQLAEIISDCKDTINIDAAGYISGDEWLYFIDGLMDTTNYKSNTNTLTFSITLEYYFTHDNKVLYRTKISHLLNKPYRNIYDKYYPLLQHRGGYNITKINRRHKRYFREYKSKHKRCIREYKSKHKKQRTKNNKTYRRFHGI